MREQLRNLNLFFQAPIRVVLSFEYVSIYFKIGWNSLFVQEQFIQVLLFSSNGGILFLHGIDDLQETDASYFHLYFEKSCMHASARVICLLVLVTDLITMLYWLCNKSAWPCKHLKSVLIYNIVCCDFAVNSCMSRLAWTCRSSIGLSLIKDEIIISERQSPSNTQNHDWATVLKLLHLLFPENRRSYYVLEILEVESIPHRIDTFRVMGENLC